MGKSKQHARINQKKTEMLIYNANHSKSAMLDNQKSAMQALKLG